MATKFFRNPQSEDYLLGVPSADLTDEDFNALEATPRAELEAYVENGGKGWNDKPYANDALDVADQPPQEEPTDPPLQGKVPPMENNS